MPFIATILNFLLGGGLAAIGKTLVDLYSKKQDTLTNADRLLADVTAKEIDANAKLLVAEQGNWMTRWVRPAWAAPFVLFTWKIVVYDKMMGLGSTDALDPNMWNLMMVIGGAYFGGRTIEKVVRILANGRADK
jgi:hypothetical protein